VSERIGRYRVLRKLGSGGMGEIYLARDASLERSVALKLLREESASEPDARARFRREAKSLAALNHPGIVTIYEIGRDSDRDFIAMEYLEGSSLREMFRAGIDQGALLGACAHTAMAVAAAHRAGVLHRDLKPDNIMLTGEGMAKVVDFGLAQRLAEAPAELGDTQRLAAMLADTLDLGEHDPSVIEETGTIFGTPGYMPPEVLRGEGSSEAGDVYSLGVVLFEGVAGRLPFLGPTVPDTLAQIMDPAVLPPRLDSLASCEAELADLVATMLAKNPDARPAMDEVASSLAELVPEFKSGRLTGYAVPEASPARTAPLRVGARRGAAYIGIAIAAAAALILLATLWPREAASPASPPLTRLVAVAPIDVDDDLRRHVELGRVTAGILLGSYLEQAPGLEVVATDRLVSATQEVGASSQAQRRAARDLGALLLVTGAIRPRGEEIVAELRVIDTMTERGELLAETTISIPAQELGAIFPAVARALAAQLVPDVELASDAPRYDLSALEVFHRGIESILAADWVAAVVHLEHAVSTQPEFFDAWYHLALAGAWARQSPTRTIEAAERAADLAHAERDRALMRGIVLYVELRFAEAIEILRPLAEDHPRDRDVLYLLAESLHHDGRYDEAAKLFDRVLRAAPGYVPAAVHPFHLAAARRDERGASFYLGFHGDARSADYLQRHLDIAMGRYERVLDSDAWDDARIAALALTGRLEAIDGFVAGARGEPSADANDLARGLATGDDARTGAAFQRLADRLSASSNPTLDEWLLRRTGTSLIIAGARDYLEDLLVVWEGHEASPFLTSIERWLRLHASVVLEREELLALDHPSTVEAQVIEAARAELRGEHAEAIARWRAYLETPDETGDYLARYALARNLEAEGRVDELVELCDEMRAPAVYAPAFHVLRARCAAWLDAPR
jgi:tRNA A-37 threonylcarbamoyl transferase component Bud32/tetratricopeptide (TPR) repeat protein